MSMIECSAMAWLERGGLPAYLQTLCSRALPAVLGRGACSHAERYVSVARDALQCEYLRAMA